MERPAPARHLHGTGLGAARGVGRPAPDRHFHDTKTGANCVMEPRAPDGHLHYTEPGANRVVEQVAPLAALPAAGTLDVGPEATRVSFMKLGANKGVGYDCIPAELLRAGGSALACKDAARRRPLRGGRGP